MNDVVLGIVRDMGARETAGGFQVVWNQDGRKVSGKTYYTDSELDAAETLLDMAYEGIGEGYRITAAANPLTKRLLLEVVSGSQHTKELG